MSSNRVATTNPDTIALIEQVVEEFRQQGKIFFAVEVSNEVKIRGAAMNPPRGMGTHSEMAPVVEQLLHQGRIPGYESVLVPVLGGTRRALLYQPMGTSADVTRSHHNRTVDVVPPVGATSPKQADSNTKSGRSRRMIAIKNEIAKSVNAVQDDLLGTLAGHILDGSNGGRS